MKDQLHLDVTREREYVVNPIKVHELSDGRKIVLAHSGVRNKPYSPRAIYQEIKRGLK